METFELSEEYIVVVLFTVCLVNVAANNPARKRLYEHANGTDCKYWYH